MAFYECQFRWYAGGSRSKKLLILSAIFNGHLDQNADSWRQPCHNCLGEKCDLCNNKGEFKHNSPPTKILNDKCVKFFNAYVMLKNYNIWPRSGGLENQYAKFLAVVQYCDRVQIKLDHIDKKNVKENNDIKSKFISLKGGNSGR